LGAQLYLSWYVNPVVNWNEFRFDGGFVAGGSFR
jgi:hypothetical protein